LNPVSNTVAVERFLVDQKQQFPAVFKWNATLVGNPLCLHDPTITGDGSTLFRVARESALPPPSDGALLRRAGANFIRPPIAAFSHSSDRRRSNCACAERARRTHLYCSETIRLRQK